MQTESETIPADCREGDIKVKVKLIITICYFALAVFGLAGLAYADDGCTQSKRVDMPNCAPWKKKEVSGHLRITVNNNCSYKMEVKVDMKPTWSCWGGFDTKFTVESGQTKSSSEVCGKLRDVYCCATWWDSGNCPNEYN